MKSESGEKKKLVFFVKPGLDNFLKDIVGELSVSYAVRTVYVTTNLKDIETHMNDADLCWFEWCDELLIHGSQLAIAKHKKVICRIHSYEVFTNYVRRVNWKVVDQVIFVAEHIRQYAVTHTPGLLREQTVVIPNGIKMEKHAFKERTEGFKIAHVGYINFKKGPMLLLHAFHAIHKKDSRYELYIAGTFQEPRYYLYFNQMIKELGLEKSVFIEGWQQDIDRWLEDKHYLLSSSVLESQHLSVMEAMAKGIKPLVHNFVGAKSIYSEEFVWSSIDELIDMVTKGSYDSHAYRGFVQDNYAFDVQMHKIRALVKKEMNQHHVYPVYYKGAQCKFFLPNQNDHIQRILAHGQKFYEEAMLADIEHRVPANSVIIDVGAYIGNHSVFFAKHCDSQVYSIEPNRESFDLLKKNLQLNQVEDRTMVWNMGLGKESGKASLESFSDQNLGMSKLNRDDEGLIHIETIDHLLADLHRVDVMKVDVEGMELDVLQGAEATLKKHCPLLYIETTTPEHHNQIAKYLKNIGYQSDRQFNATPTTLFIHRR
ncbi:FkbM family methyltransferase [Halobacillus salinus]|uniref:FkbM family methyltransferase n=1 Tax=Halobacillus salinus TaxID=192814 RepID=A0A4Z0GUD3_9BACI|nr:FkbM family methyltransferase [Halobacillus salinus]TGB00739.1 FkbM family methyltransferase [Halobacillus salinus]